ncbi:unnamed protein product [Durusdinium trenchii]|uniref:Ubiquitin-like domain-containing protein n=1 Tax=Durusdinium trenchii TaxID=1381693 RepID=A0ABP0NP19_9DINO
MALRLLWAASGENAVVFSDEEFQALVQERGNTIKALKLELMSRGFGSRFRLRLLRAGEHLELSDDVVIVPPLVLKMVRLAFLPADEERDEEFLEACAEGHLEEVERRLHQPQDPNTADRALQPCMRQRKMATWKWYAYCWRLGPLMTEPHHFFCTVLLPVATWKWYACCWRLGPLPTLQMHGVTHFCTWQLNTATLNWYDCCCRLGRLANKPLLRVHLLCIMRLRMVTWKWCARCCRLERHVIMQQSVAGLLCTRLL